MKPFRKHNRYCAVKDDIVYYFESKTSKKPLGRIDLKGKYCTEATEICLTIFLLNMVLSYHLEINYAMVCL
jgi:hypothetical protein